MQIHCLLAHNFVGPQKRNEDGPICFVSHTTESSTAPDFLFILEIENGSTEKIDCPSQRPECYT